MNIEREITYIVYNSVRKSVWDSASDAVGDSVSFFVENYAWMSVRESVQNYVKEEINTYEY